MNSDAKVMYIAIIFNAVQRKIVAMFSAMHLHILINHMIQSSADVTASLFCDKKMRSRQFPGE